MRSVWDEEKEEWYFSIVDVVAVWTESKDPKQYIKKMRSGDEQLNLKWGTICTPVKMIAADGKKRSIQASNMQGIFQIIQSVPSPKSEPFKLWFAEVGKERIDEIIDPKLTILSKLMEDIVKEPLNTENYNKDDSNNMQENMS